MYTIMNLYSNQSGEISRFLSRFYEKEIKLENDLKWEKEFQNGTELADIIGIFIDNREKYRINMWVSLDEGAFLNITEDNADQIIRYLYERFPY
ncbi:MAG: hypothetical protein HFJ26_07325 [Clostridia bacterium]|jgi:hypothetical protein|nr:hypothetical protein [Clostridia bacterium]